MPTCDSIQAIPILQESSELRTAAGFWSGNTIQYNPTNKIILISELTPFKIKEIIRESFDIEDAISSRLNMCCQKEKPSELMLQSGKNLKNYFDLQAMPSFQDKRFRARGNRYRTLIYSDEYLVSWLAVGTHLKEQELAKAEEIDLIAKEFVAAYADGHAPIKHAKGLGADWLQLLHPGLTALLDRELTVDTLLASLSVLFQFQLPQAAHRDLPQLALINAPIIELCLRYKLPVTSIEKMYDARWLLSLSHAAGVLLSLLAMGRYILLPSNWAGLEYTRLVSKDWFKGRGRSKTDTLLGRLLVSSTINSLEDIPEDIHRLIDGVGDQQILNVLFKPRLLAHQEQQNLPPWPITQLNRKKSTRNQLSKIWTPQWLSENGYSEAWIAFVSRHWEINNSGDHQLKDNLRRLLIWAKESDIESPANIDIKSLRDVFNPNRKDTYFWYIQNQSIENKWQAWAAPSAAFKRIVNSLKVDPNPLIPISESPFELLSNPFKNSSKNKTVRKRLPSSIHEAMIDVLLEPDGNGVPTYRWVKEQLEWDWYDRVNNQTLKIERVWCPSRSACLALLLLLPLRKKQARWLDRGLMDEHVWNVELDQWEENSHSLVRWRSPIGLPHYELYKRYSGVLQPLFDPLSAQEELGLFINTNKTQMWNPDQVTGYELPWPSSHTTTDNNKNTSEKISWLERPYTVIKQQIRWQNLHNPIPIPASAMDFTEDSCSQNTSSTDRLPYFCPVFSDLTTGFTSLTQNGNTVYGPVASRKLTRLFHALSVETENRLREQGQEVSLTKPATTSTSDNFEGKVSLFDIHSLRVAGISRLIEVGVPAHIVQEFVVGHATVAMTHYYKKHETSFLKMKLLEALEENDIIGKFESLKPKLSKREDLFVSVDRYKQHRPTALMDVYTGWKFVAGGICPLGGTGCETGQPIEVISANGKEREGYGPVSGGCGNCRFFSTGPAFLIHQAQAANEIMLEARSLGRTRKGLYHKLSELEWGNPSAIKAQQDSLQKATIKDQITDIDLHLEPLILEWFNRHQMFEESSKLIDSWEEFKTGNKNSNQASTLVLLSGAISDDVTQEIDIRLKKCGDFALVRSILEGAMIRGGLEKASSLAKDKMREFIDRILRSENTDFLLIDIKDESIKNKVAFQIAALTQHLVGDSAVQDTLDNHSKLSLNKSQREQWRVFSKEIFQQKISVESTLSPLITAPNATIDSKG